MSTNVVALPGSRVPNSMEPDEALVKTLEDVLARARSGYLRSFVGTGFCADGARLSVWGGDLYTNVYATAGALHWLQAEYTDQVTGHAPRVGEAG